MKVLITGATGFIGNHVAKFCLEQGDDVKVMVMPGEDLTPLANMKVEVCEGNLLEKDSLRSPMQGVEGVYHLAGLFSVWTKDPDLHFRVNVEGTNHLLKSAVLKNLCSKSLLVIVFYVKGKEQISYEVRIHLIK